MKHGLVVLALFAVACTATSTQTTVDPTEIAFESISPDTSPTTAAGTPSGTVGSLVCWSAEPASGTADISFSDITEDVGLIEPLTGMHGHAAAWGDVNGDDLPDLVVGTFANRPVERYQVRGADGPSPDKLLLGRADGSFTSVDGFPPLLGRTSGPAIVDLDNDGDHDIVLSRNMRDRQRGDVPTQIYRNDGGSYSLIDVDLGRLFSGRSIGVFDYDRDGLLDLLILEDRYGSADSSVLLRNEGELRFKDVTAEAGLPDGLHGLGVATSDLNGDGRTDFFVGGSNRLFVATDDGFIEMTSSVFEWDVFGNEDDVAGASIADLNRDGLPDLVVDHDSNSTLSRGQTVPVRVYLNSGNDEAGLPVFRDVTDQSGIDGLPTKAPHVEIADMDNDGWPDLVTTAAADDGRLPAVFRNLGPGPDGIPTFESPTGLGSAQYWVAGPTADVDRDGRLDVLLVEWEPSLPSLLLRNVSASGNWLEVSVSETPIGTKVWLYEAGRLGDLDALVGMREIVVSQGYTSGNLAVAHLGLGDVEAVDVRVAWADGTEMIVTDIAANAHVRIPGGC